MEVPALFDPAPAETIAIVGVTFLLAGFVKGVVGLGLPIVALGALTLTLGLKEAVALMLVPTFVTNVWQGLAGGAFVAIVRRLWTLLVPACLGIWLAAGVMARAEAELLSALLGALLAVYSIFGLTMPRTPSPGHRELWLSPAVGAINGIFSGLTGAFAVPAVLYLQALGLERDVLIQAMGVLFTVSAVALAAALAEHGLLSTGTGLRSALAVVPALLGMTLGQRVRTLIPEAQFRRVFFTALLILGAYLVAKGVV